MGLFGKSYNGPEKIQYLFIDGAYFDYVVKEIARNCFDMDSIPIDAKLLGQGHTKIFYYDCLAPKQTNESESDYETRIQPQIEQFRYMRSLPGWHVFEGYVKRQRRGVTQKEVDVMIAVDMLTHTYRRNMHQLTFIAGDQDFRPVIEAVIREGMYVELRYGAGHVSDELLGTADAQVKLDAYAIHAIASHSFKIENPLPIIQSGVNSSARNGWVPMFAGVDEHGNRIEIRRDAERNEYVAVMEDIQHFGSDRHYRHAGLELVKRVVALRYGVAEWGAA